MKLNIENTFGNRRIIIFIVLFFLFLFYFFLSSNWHIPSRIIISGTSVSGTEAMLRWDSGEGFNHVESKMLDFGKPLVSDKSVRVIIIRRLGEKNPASYSSKVWIKEIFTDDKLVPFEQFTGWENIKLLEKSTLYLQKDDARIKLKVKCNNTVKIRFVKNILSGYVEIDIDGDSKKYDLYSLRPDNKTITRRIKKSVPGDFSVVANLPQYNINGLKLESVESNGKFRLKSVEIESENGKIPLPVNKDRFVSAVAFSDIKRLTKKYFNPIRFSFQLVFAVFSAYLVVFVFNFINKHGGLKSTLFDGKRFVFWLMFSGAVFTFFAWLLAYWPGHMTSDSIDIWRAAKIPGYFYHYHPFLNIIYYRFLQQIWDSIAVVGICQILLASLLGSYIFYYIYKNGVSIFFLLPFYLFFICSVPVGLYNVTLWKDTPFAILVVFWAFYLAKLFYEKKKGDANLRIPELISLFILFVAICLIRHNGIVYVIIIPTAFVFLRLISFKKLGAVSVVSLILFGIFIIFVFPRINKTDFFSQQSRVYFDSLRKIDFYDTLRRVSHQYLTILDINSNKSKSDVWDRSPMSIQWHWDFVKRIEYNDYFNYSEFKPKSDWLYKLLRQLNNISYKKPWVYFNWNPFYMVYLYLLPFILYKYFPLTAIYSYVVLSQVFMLILVLDNVNWRYYYFLLLSAYFLIPIAALDIKIKRSRLPFSRRQREEDVSPVLPSRV
jgi:hypothetical protein